MSDAEPQQASLLTMENIVKAFPGSVALDNASLSVARGEIHAIVGQNGAGKSTMMKIVNGAYRRNSGTLLFDGRPVDFVSPLQAQAAGVSTIYQEINLVPYRSVAENILMGREPRRFGLINWPAMNRRASEILARLNIHIDVHQPLMNYNVALQQMVAIARAVSVTPNWSSWMSPHHRWTSARSLRSSMSFAVSRPAASALFTFPTDWTNCPRLRTGSPSCAMAGLLPCAMRKT